MILWILAGLPFRTMELVQDPPAENVDVSALPHLLTSLDHCFSELFLGCLHLQDLLAPKGHCWLFQMLSPKQDFVR